ncbi:MULTISPECIES: SUMF1/EgtB/PvdO family nonheme iron enzyme [unclassified Prochlorococcus]|uniref:SUMF1/EgtB/PvdO family nonheme iron enzyme n=1 Tax=unclassified Prochlorococcus TaxID=2627481 RepID=UPI0039A5630B
MSILDNDNDEDQANIDAIQTNVIETYPASENNPVSENSPDPALSLNPVATASALTASTDAEVAANGANSPFEYYVSNNGDDTNQGTLEAPFKTIQHAITKVKAGDTVQIRGGIYREKLLLEDINGTKDNPVTFKNYPNEEVIISGAKEITTPWKVHKGNIWKTNVDFDVTQLFLDDKMLTAARWPNITKDWDQLDDSDGNNPTPDSYWDLKTSAEIQSEVDQKPGSYKNLEEKHSLSSLGASVEGAVFVRYGSDVVDVTQHTAGESSFEINGTVDLTETSYLSQTGKIYYLTADLDLLDQPREWYYDKDSGELYAWLENNDDPNSRDMESRGYTTTNYGDEDDILTANDCSFLNFKGITLRTGTFQLRGTSDTEFDDCKFLYSGHNTHMLGADAVYNKGTKFEENSNHYGNDAGGGSLGIEFEKDGNNYSNPANIAWRNCEFAYSYNTLLYHGKNGRNFIIDNCYFHNKPSGAGAIWTGQTKGNNTIRRVTAHTIGTGGLGKVGNGNNEGAVVELTHIYDYHFHGDDAGIQINTGNTAGMVIKNNWIHVPGRNGIRFDGDEAGMRGTAHHNVLFENKRGTRLKGDQHTILNNLAFDNTHVDINVSHDKFYGYIDPDKKFTDNVVELYQNRAEGRRGGRETHQGNHYSIVHNNVGNKNSQIYVLNPEDNTGNLSRLELGQNVRNELRDPDNFDFRPKENSALVDLGTHLAPYTNNYIGDAPDIGPYEYGDLNYWIPGYQAEKASMPISPNGSITVKQNADLMWLEGREAITNDIYFGSSAENLEFQRNQQNNIFTPSNLEQGQKYYWRIDTVTDDELITGDVWNFSVPIAQYKPINIPTVLVEDEGNESDSTGFGAVSYPYYIGKYEVTNSEYTQFLNSAAQTMRTDQPLYNTEMAENGGIIRNGEDGSYSYNTIEGRENHPVNFVSYWSALRFSNWMTSGDTEKGMYEDINGVWKRGGANRRSEDAWATGGVALANEDEWYKAAYYSGTTDGANGDSYWDLATQNNSLNLDESNHATLSSPSVLLDVGSYQDHPSYYGTFDQTGNVREWLQEEPDNDSIYTILRGGSRGNYKKMYNLYKSGRVINKRGIEDANTGIRLVSLLPIGFDEPDYQNQAPSWIATRWSLGESIAGQNFSTSLIDTVYDPENDPLSFSLISGPEWIAVDVDGSVTATPSAEDIGSHNVMLRVTDSSGHFNETEVPVPLVVNGTEVRANPEIASSWVENPGRTLDSDIELGYSLHLKEGTEADQATARKQLAVLGDSVDLSDTYRLDITAKSLAAGYNLETADITINFDPYLFDEIKASDITIGGQLPIANAVQIDNVEGTIRIAAASLGDLEAGDLYGNHLTDAGASIGTDGAVLASIDLDFNELNLAELKKNLDGSIDDLSTPLFFGLSANQDETVFSTALDDESGFANREIKSLRELGGDLAVDGTKVTLYEAEINLKEQGDGLILSSDLDIGSYHSSKTNLLRKGDTITATSEWTNVGNIKATDIAITGVANDNASLSSSSFYISTTEGEGYQALTNLESGSFSSTTGAFDSTGQETAQLVADIEITGAAGNVVDLSAGILSLKAEGSDVFENKLGSKNLITYQGDLNYDGRVSMKDLAYLNAGAARQQLVSEGQAAADANNDGFVDASVARGVDANFDGQISMADLAVLDADWGKSLHQVPQASTDAFLGESEISWEQLESQGTTGDTTWDNQAFKDQNALEADNDFVESLESPAAVGVIDADGDSSRTDNDIAGDYFQDPLSA